MSASASTPLALPKRPPNPKPGFYRSGKGVVLYGTPGGRFDGGKPATRSFSWAGKPQAEETFSSPMVRWANMHFMGGYHWRPHDYVGETWDKFRGRKALVDAVIAGKKPAATTGRIGGGGYGADPKADVREAKRLHAKAKAAGLYVGPLDTTRTEWLAFTMAQKGTLAQNFDLDDWIDTWSMYGVDVLPMEARFWSTQLSALIELFDEDEGALPGPIVGLLLGYPVFSTASVYGAA